MKTGVLPAASTSADYTQDFEVVVDGEAVDLSTVDDITIVIRRQRDASPELTLTMSDGDITLVDSDTKFRLLIEADRMGNLLPQTYDVGCIATEGTETRQFVVGHLPVIDGIV